MHGVLDEHQINHALMTLIHGRQRGETEAMAPFVVTRSGGEILNVHLVPISGRERRWHGYILTLDDVTHRVSREKFPPGRALGSRLIEKQRSAAAAIRGAIETIIAYPDIDAPSRREFQRRSTKKLLKMSDISPASKIVRPRIPKGRCRTRWRATFSAAIQRHLQGILNVEIEVSVPIEPLRSGWIAMSLPARSFS